MLTAWLKSLVLLVGVGVLSLWVWRQQTLHFSAGWNFYLLPGAALSLLSFVCFALRFRCVARVVGHQLACIEALRIASFALFGQFVLPFAAGADLTKFAKLRARAPQRRAIAGAAGIVLEHVLGLAAIGLVVAVLMIVFQPVVLRFAGAVAIAGGLALLAVGGMALLWARPLWRADAAHLLTQIGAHKCDLVAAIAYSLAMQLLLAAAVYVGSCGWGLGMPYWQVLLVQASAGVLQAIPLGVAGVGVTDVAGSGLYLALGQPWPAAVLLVSLLYSYRLLVAVLGGLWEAQALR